MGMDKAILIFTPFPFQSRFKSWRFGFEPCFSSTDQTLMLKASRVDFSTSATIILFAWTMNDWMSSCTRIPANLELAQQMECSYNTVSRHFHLISKVQKNGTLTPCASSTRQPLPIRDANFTRDAIQELGLKVLLHPRNPLASSVVLTRSPCQQSIHFVFKWTPWTEISCFSLLY